MVLARAWRSMLSFRMVRDVAPGEAVFIDEHGRLHATVRAYLRHTRASSVCFARPDSKIDNISFTVRACVGDHLADKILRERQSDIDVIDSIPDTSRTAPCSSRSGWASIPRGLHPEPLHRPHLHHAGAGSAKSVRKLDAIDLEFRGKRVLLVDDSIVRGTTSAQIIELARGRCRQGSFRLGRAAGALPQRVRHRHAGNERGWWRAAAPRMRWRKSLAQTGSTGSRGLIACKHEDARIEEFDTSCFSGVYVTGDITPVYLERLQLERSDAAKLARRDGRGKLKVVR
jgi:amidophosphoribosyltransferase